MNGVFFITFEFMLRRKTLQFILNIFPPLLFNRIILKEISEDYTYMKVKIRRSILNINFHRTIFGGSIFSWILAITRISGGYPPGPSRFLPGFQSHLPPELTYLLHKKTYQNRTKNKTHKRYDIMQNDIISYMVNH